MIYSPNTAMAALHLNVIISQNEQIYSLFFFLYIFEKKMFYCNKDIKNNKKNQKLVSNEEM